MWELVERIFMMIKNSVGFIIVEFVVVMSQMAVNSPFLGLKSLGAGWGQ